MRAPMSTIKATSELSASLPTRAMQRRQKRFLSSFATSHADLALACRRSKVPVKTVRRWRYDHATFQEEYNEAEESAMMALESVARAAAFNGSERLLIFLLSSRLPLKYGYAAQRKALEEETQESTAELYRELQGALRAVDDFCPPVEIEGEVIKSVGTKGNGGGNGSDGR